MAKLISFLASFSPLTLTGVTNVRGNEKKKIFRAYYHGTYRGEGSTCKNHLGPNDGRFTLLLP